MDGSETVMNCPPTGGLLLANGGERDETDFEVCDAATNLCVAQCGDFEGAFRPIPRVYRLGIARMTA
jgi:hypothetical protein